MKRIPATPLVPYALTALAAFAICATAACAPSSPEKSPTKTATAETTATAATTAGSLSVGGFSAPESVLYDKERDQYFVSNLVGDAFTADHDGFISRLAPDGRITALRFIDGRATQDGLSAPKGMALVHRTLYVTDIDRIRLYDADTGAARGIIPIAGSTCLNDLDAAPDGTVYFTDTGIRRDGTGFAPTGTDAIYAITEGRSVRRIARGDLGRPNGIIWNDGKLEVVTLGSGEWLTVSLAGEILQRTPLPHDILDGLAKLDSGAFLISSWGGSRIYRILPGGLAEPILSAKSPADFAYDKKRARLVVPLMLEDRVLFAPLPH
ncbi:SMP-30/gluconolactonase/LRE family protein [Pendulispora albinea]|uniref:SMP-30/gluconolactonase/LRE family protein n=1 Tax=Pendulispora albinea TaxID=2741071 RepID=A0ABZ2MC33_9BACT